MKNFLTLAIAMIAFTNVYADLVVDSVGVVHMENSVVDTEIVNKLLVDSIALDNGISIHDQIINADRSSILLEKNVCIRDITCHNSFNTTTTANTYAFTAGSTRPTAYFYNYNNGGATPAITSETFDANGLIFSGTYKNAGVATAQIRADGSYFSRGGYITASDGSLKENIVAVSNSLDALCDVTPVSYTLKDISKDDTNDSHNSMQRAASQSETATPAPSAWGNEMSRAKYGFIAEDIEEIFPNVVYTMPTGEKGIAYQELIPILVGAIQELKEEIETLKEDANEIPQRQQAPAAIEEAVADGSAALMQNTPNPFNQATEIGYRLPEGTATAIIMVCDMNGKMLQTYPLAVNATAGTLTLQAGSYTPGMYLYTLLVDGVQIDTKQMIILAH